MGGNHRKTEHNQIRQGQNPVFMKMYDVGERAPSAGIYPMKMLGSCVSRVKTSSKQNLNEKRVNQLSVLSERRLKKILSVAFCPGSCAMELSEPRSCLTFACTVFATVTSLSSDVGHLL